jgi:hypothetical protein
MILRACLAISLFLALGQGAWAGELIQEHPNRDPEREVPVGDPFSGGSGSGGSCACSSGEKCDQAIITYDGHFAHLTKCVATKYGNHIQLECTYRDQVTGKTVTRYIVCM